MPKRENLIPEFHVLTDDERIRGGRKSGETRRLQGAIRRALSSRADSAEFRQLFEKFGTPEESRDYANAIACAGILKAAMGDKGWAEYIRNTVGEKPIDEAEDGGGRVVIIDDIG